MLRGRTRIRGARVMEISAIFTCGEALRSRSRAGGTLPTGSRAQAVRDQSQCSCGVNHKASKVRARRVNRPAKTDKAAGRNSKRRAIET